MTSSHECRYSHHKNASVLNRLYKIRHLNVKSAGMLDAVMSRDEYHFCDIDKQFYIMNSVICDKYNCIEDIEICITIGNMIIIINVAYYSDKWFL